MNFNLLTIHWNFKDINDVTSNNIQTIGVMTKPSQNILDSNADMFLF